MFPTTWLQVWVTLPDTGVDVNKATLFWFFVDGTVDPATFNNSLMNVSAEAWAYSVFSATAYSVNLTSQMLVKWYLQTPSALLFDSYVIYTYPQDVNLLPGSVSVVIQRLTTGFGQSARGRCFIPSPRQFYTNGKILNNLGITAYQNLATAMSQPFSSQGINFFPALASYSHSTLTILSECRAQFRLGNVLRRSRSRTPASLTTPKVPPP